MAKTNLLRHVWIAFLKNIDDLWAGFHFHFLYRLLLLLLHLPPVLHPFLHSWCWKRNQKLWATACMCVFIIPPAVIWKLQMVTSFACAALLSWRLWVYMWIVVFKEFQSLRFIYRVVNMCTWLKCYSILLVKCDIANILLIKAMYSSVLVQVRCLTSPTDCYAETYWTGQHNFISFILVYRWRTLPPFKLQTVFWVLNFLGEQLVYSPRQIFLSLLPQNFCRYIMHLNCFL